jgi:hypothetical protein
VTTWVPLIGLLVVGTGAQWIAGHVRVGSAQTIATWGAGVIALLCYLAAGVYATSTWIGRDAVPFAAGIHPFAAVAAGLAAIAAAVLIVLAAIPDRWSSLAASTGVLVLAFLAPSLVRYLPAGDVPDGARAVLTAMWGAASDVTAGWFS